MKKHQLPITITSINFLQPRKFWVMLFFWVSICQTVVTHDQHHSIEAENTCLVCFSQSNLDSTTLHSEQIQTLQNKISIRITPNQIIHLNVNDTPFSSRDPPV